MPLDAVRATTERFEAARIRIARLEAEALLAHVVGTSLGGLYSLRSPLEADQLAAFTALVERRLAGEPLAYLLGRVGFRSLRIEVNRRVLVPRPGTETLIDAAKRAVARLPRPLRIADVATGSGVIALVLASELPEASLVATDLSDDALAVARGNVDRLGLAGRIELRAGDLLAPLAGERFAMIVSNPPYVPTADLAALPIEVTHEPRGALDGGADGLDLIRRLVADAPAHLAAGGFLAIEHGLGQSPAIAGILRGAGFTDVTGFDAASGDILVTAGWLARGESR